jgi:hypothetical protein
LSDADTLRTIAPEAAAEPAGAAEAAGAHPCSAGRSAHAKRAARSPNGTFASMGGRKPRPKRTAPQVKSRVSNGSHLFITGPAQSAASRRLADVLSEIVGDLGGSDNLSEGQRQLARRAAALSVACERLEATICNGVSSAAEAAFTEASGGLSPYVILREAGRILHGIGRTRGGNDIKAMAALTDDKLAVVTDLLKAAGELAAKAIAAGSAQSADLQLYGMLADRCGRTFSRLGIKRQPRDLGLVEANAQPEPFSPLREQLRKEALAREQAQQQQTTWDRSQVLDAETCERSQVVDEVLE